MSRIRKLLFAAAGLAAFGASQALAEVTVLGWPGGPEETALRAAAEAYNATAADADKVKLIFFNRDGFFDKLAADLGAGTTDFDINLIATYAVGRYAPFMDVVELPASATDTFGEKVLATMQFDGQQYGVPTDLSLHFMYYRQDLIDRLLSDDAWKAKYTAIAKEKMGKDLGPKDPDQWTWDDFEATAYFFTKEINPDSPTRYGAVLQMKNLLFNMMVWHSTARSNGGNWMDAEGKVTVDSPAYRTALELYKRLYDAGVTPKDSTTYEYARPTRRSGRARRRACFSGTRRSPTSTMPRRLRRSRARLARSRRLQGLTLASPTSTASASASTRPRRIRKAPRSSSPGSPRPRRSSSTPRPAARQR
jgi:multiple sugar transport system substrate-binding protein